MKEYDRRGEKIKEKKVRDLNTVIVHDTSHSQLSKNIALPKPI